MRCLILIMFCAVIILSPMPGAAAVIGRTNQAVRELADPLLDNVLKGLADEDYFKYSRDFDNILKETITMQRFQEIRKKIQGWVGNYLYREYLGFINRKEISIVFWKGAFDQSKDEILMKMVIIEQDGKYLINGLWFE